MENLKVRYSKYIPFKGYFAITLFDYMVIREENRNRAILITTWNHENWHASQVRDFYIGWCGYFIFYFLYVLEWVLKLPFALFGYKPYRSISFEQDAFANQDKTEKLYNRKKFSWVKYIFKLVK